MTAVLLGLDVGTSVTKAALFDRRGVEVAAASVKTSLIEGRPGWSELDPDEAWRGVADVCRAVLAKAGLAGGDVAAVACAGAMVGAWLIDQAGAPVRPAILWNDGRAGDLVQDRLRARPSLFSDIFARSGSLMQLGCTLPVLAWLARHEPDALARARTVLMAKDFIRFRLTGEIGTDESEATVGPGSARDRGFAPELFGLFDLDHAATLLPPVGRSEAIAGRVTPAAAGETGLRAGTPVAFGLGDTPACVIGAGIGSPGSASSILGTTCLNGVVLDEPTFEPADLGLLFTLPGGLWMKTMVNVAGTTNLDWCLAALCPDLADRPDRYERLGVLADRGGIGAGGVTFVPYLSSSGIISPRIEGGARAGFLGLEPRHGRAHLVRAIYEGVALSIRDCFEAIGRPITTIRLVGGGAQSLFWSQMIADVVGVPVEVPKGTQFGAKGAALMAGIAVGWYGSVAEATRLTFQSERRHDPDPPARPAYDEAYRRYKVVSAGCLDAIAPAYRCPRP